MTSSQSESVRPLILIGYMASGKTTLGRALADATGRRFIDLDEYIVAREGRAISEIFRDDGEEYFRRMERASLAELLVSPASDIIIACGGGTPCFSDNMDRMNAGAQTVWLTPSLEVILRRLRDDRASRPLVASLGDSELQNYVVDNMSRRENFYAKAQSCFDSSFLESEDEIRQSVEKFIKTLL